jgi:hypothetical protein
LPGSRVEPPTAKQNHFLAFRVEGHARARATGRTNILPLSPEQLRHSSLTQKSIASSGPMLERSQITMLSTIPEQSAAASREAKPPRTKKG